MCTEHTEFILEVTTNQFQEKSKVRFVVKLTKALK